MNKLFEIINCFVDQIPPLLQTANNFNPKGIDIKIIYDNNNSMFNTALFLSWA